MNAVPLVDGHGRTVRDLRISVTDRCNFRCTYCMPAEGLDWVPRDQVLTFEEITRIAALCVERFGFDGVRLTGGEPTVRAGITDLVAMLSALGIDLAMTTNGSTLAGANGGLARRLKTAGLNRINISLDSLHADRFSALTRRPPDELTKVLDGIDAAVAAGFDPVKVNIVLVKGVNDDETLALADFGRDRNVQLRFIEFMPLDADQGWTIDQVVPAKETVATIGAVHPLEAVQHGSEPATRHRYVDGKGEIGVIPSVTAPFCGDCDRVRLTAEGQFRTCLFALDEFDLRSVIRDGGSDDDVAEVIQRAVGAKWAGHSIGAATFIRPKRSMSQIGG